MVTTTNPRTGVSAATTIESTPDAEVDRIARRAADAAPAIAAIGREGRAALLDAIGDALEEGRKLLVQTAAGETGLGLARLNGELSRSIFQFQLFAEAIREGSYLEAMIDHAGDTPLGPGPDLRRILLPVGPVAVFGSSNFPFAFSVAGGDTASALAAGCTVVLKAHSAHPLTSQRSFDALASALAVHGVPHGTLGIVFGQAAGASLVAHPAIKAVGFTGSLSGGKALQSIIDGRKELIPFYGELSSFNPLVITEQATNARTSEIAEGLFTSFTGSGGQLCTKPGIAFVPVGESGDRLVEAIRELVVEAKGQVLLNRRIFDAYQEIGDRLVAHGADIGARATLPDDAVGFLSTPTLLTTSAAEFTADLAEECFGPLMVVARYEDAAQLSDAFAQLPSSLTSTIHSEEGESELVARLTDQLAPLSGRIVYNGYPTGVRVSWAQHHGGPWPATNTLHTSVGVTAMRRFLRPFVWQNAPQAVLPLELRDGETSVPRRIDGKLVLPACAYADDNG